MNATIILIVHFERAMHLIAHGWYCTRHPSRFGNYVCQDIAIFNKS